MLCVRSVLAEEGSQEQQIRPHMFLVMVPPWSKQSSKQLDISYARLAFEQLILI